MEAASEGEKKKPPEGGGSGEGGEQKPKRKMKTASQLELLEKTYAVEAYPSESLRAELSAKLGLTDRQLQMWFCHRRLKDRKVAPVKRQRKDTPVSGGGDDMVVGGELGNEPGSGPGSGSSPFGQGEPRKVVARAPSIVPIIGADMPMMKRYYEPQQSILELRAIAFVEAQLGEPLREDGPILGMEFDPLPPDAFGAPLAIMGQQKQAGRPYDGKVYERHDAKPIKTSSLLPNMEHGYVPSSSGGKRKVPAGVHVVHHQTAARAVQEYQFLPEQPTVRSDTYERVGPSHYYNLPVDGPSARASSLSSGGAFIHGNEQVGTGYGFHGQVSGVGHLSHQGRKGHVFSSGSGGYENVSHRNSFTNIEMDPHFGAHPIVGLENPFVPSDRRVSHDEDVTRMERKRKSEEARIAREVEAHEKRIRKELEKQDILRRKREEQMRKEMERHDRERRKEEERLMREKQREEERFQREQRRENERRERFLQKETLRAEKLRQKEELRREKEAARIKAANERATARRIAKESMELIEDERLELMELAVSTKGLPSILYLDSETLQNLQSFRDMLSTFPPESVRLKMPFSIQPWTNSEENIGNLLMVWRFLITFADVLGLWPFTLDEFVQALHDFDPRLLSEVHVVLLRSIIKDIEDVARTPSIGIGANQNSAANPGGGHPQIVEGAYAWGFDIRSWQRHLSPLTWPEILRQFGLSAGFGPQLKNRSIGRAYFCDDNEGHDGEDIVTTLRTGTAAENAVALMQEKGFSHPRRSRHRLTPGTVKFAAFHVLSLEGSKGLTILEVADKIQKSGLRDLTTSKTPEASIAAALSRDATLFERTAPSTYCVRPTFRKDPADAEAVLSAAREKIQIFESGFSDSEEVEKDVDDADDVERDEDSECDGADDPEVDDVNRPLNSKEAHHSAEAKATQPRTCSGNEKKTSNNEAGETPECGFASSGKGFSLFLSEVTKEVKSPGATLYQSGDVATNCNETSNFDQQDVEIDESNLGEPWVQGLMEGEYSDLSVEERLNALVALIGVAIEGNSIRVILEERLEAANALKKQMWAEAQLDKRRMKEEYIMKVSSSYMGVKTENNLISSATEAEQSPLVDVDNKNNEASFNPTKQELFLDPQNGQSIIGNLPTERNLAGQEFNVQDNLQLQQHAYATEKSRSQLKSSIGHRAEEMYVYRSLPLGQDRRRNRYWQFVTSSSKNDPGAGRIFFESHDGCWGLIDSEEVFDALMTSLDTRGIRESHLHSMLQKIEISFKVTARRNSCRTNIGDPSGVVVKIEASGMGPTSDCTVGINSPTSILCSSSSETSEQASSFKIQLGRSEPEKNDALKRYQDFQKWMWKECFTPSTLSAMKYGKKRCAQLFGTCDSCQDYYFFEDNHCPSCHRTFGKLSNSLNLKFSEHVVQCEENQKVDPDWNSHYIDSYLPLRTRLVKAMLVLVEVSVPQEAFQPFWNENYRKSWGVRLHNSSSAEELLQILTLLEGAIRRDYLSSNFETTKELLGSFTQSGSAVDSSPPESVAVLPWVPSTTAAVVLRLMEFDASISYILHEKAESSKDKEDGEFIKLPSKYTVVKNIQVVEPTEATGYGEYMQEGNWLNTGSERRSSGRGRGGRGRGRGRGRSRGGRWQRGSGSRLCKESIFNIEKAGQGLGRKGRTRGRGRRRGRRTVRSRPRTQKRVVEKEKTLGRFNHTSRTKQDSGGQSPRLVGGDWDLEETGRMHVEEADNSNSAEASEYDVNGQGTGDEYDDREADYGGIFNGKSEDLLLESEDDVEGDEEGEDADADADADTDADVEGDEDVESEEGDEDDDEEEDRDGDEGEEMDGDEVEEDENGDMEGDLDGEGNVDGDGERNGDEDEGTVSTSSEYSD
ncbi:PREDICTED: homeobox-DDT domain protein RLT2 isoform X2 [Nelumbo nucifera]|uniref:Homeobox-DDT domain protein RLT2 isoform X2 n=1 Tax=Nelumbo nucifera TaxID=4432 RepID=A0A1U8ADP1_NELNU|nr:PREDICTED: homeobox-DDT domain protein RLT2 isoform X2 [Nelumbo nucifera]